MDSDSSLVQTIDVASNLPYSVIRQACTRNHTLPLISRLLPEILQTIFIHYACDYYTTDDGYPIKSAPTWVNISYVCRHWRDVALACPALWSYLFITSPRWTRELLARSKQAPLKLQMKLVFEDHLRHAFVFLEQVTNHLERIQELDLYLDYGYTETKFYPLLSSRASRLENLKIVVSWAPCIGQFPVLFDGDTPSLRTLELSGCAVPWYSFKLTGLTTLRLHTVPVPYRKTVAEFLAMLRSIQHLEILYLHDALHTTTAFPSESRHGVNADLPHLSRLSIAAPPSTIVEFLACVNIPSKTELRLWLYYEDGCLLDDYALLFSVLGKRLGTCTDQGISAPIFHSLAIECAGLNGLTFSPLDLDLNPLVLYDRGCYNPLKIRFLLDSSATVDRILTDMSLFVPLSNIWSVHVQLPPYPADFWRTTLGHLQGLRYLKISDGNLPDIAPVLSLTDLANGDSAARQDGRADWIVLAPALEELVLMHVRLGTLPANRKWLDWQGTGDLQALCDALATRTRVAGRLVMSSCWGPPKMMRMDGEWRGGRFRAAKHHRSRGLRL